MIVPSLADFSRYKDLCDQSYWNNVRRPAVLPLYLKSPNYPDDYSETECVWDMRLNHYENIKVNRYIMDVLIIVGATKLVYFHYETYGHSLDNPIRVLGQ